MQFVRLICVSALGAACALASSVGTEATCTASDIGCFSISGDITVTSTMMTFTSDAPGSASQMFTLTLGSGIYSTEDGQNGISNLNISTEPVGGATTFTPSQFITFDVNGSEAPLFINYIYAGIYSSTGCGASPAQPGQTCTPPNGTNQSPFSFVNNPPPSDVQSTAYWVFTGIIPGTNLEWEGNFSSNFGEPFQSVLAAFAPGGSGSVSNSYAGTIEVFATPEPGPLFMMGIGLGLLALCRAGFAARKRQRSV